MASTKTRRTIESLDDLIEMGVENINARLLDDPAGRLLLLAATRKFVSREVNSRMRARAQAAERKAYGVVNGVSPDDIMAAVLDASTAAAAAATMTWRPLLSIPFLVPTKDIQTTWGQATPDMHEDRALWLEHMATGNIRTASHHRKAMADIGVAKVANLFEAVASGKVD